MIIGDAVCCSCLSPLCKQCGEHGIVVISDQATEPLSQLTPSMQALSPALYRHCQGLLVAIVTCPAA